MSWDEVGSCKARCEMSWGDMMSDDTEKLEKRIKDAVTGQEDKWHEKTNFTRTDEVRWDEKWTMMKSKWAACVDRDEVTEDAMRCNEMQWDHLRWGMWQIERPLLRSTEGFGVTFRHSLCSALYKRFNFETSAPQHAQVQLVENLRGKNGDISPPILLSMRKRQHNVSKATCLLRFKKEIKAW